MKLASINNRAHLVFEDGVIDINAASGSRFSACLTDLLPQLEEVERWLEVEFPEKDARLNQAMLLENLSLLDTPVAQPSQIFAVGLNYKAHSEEADMDVPDEPMIFTKFPSSLAGPGADVVLTSDKVDWEVEMVLVVGKGGRNISREKAMAHVAGFCVGQDISDRDLQFRNSPAQFSLAKSYPNFAPVGPWITTSDEVEIENLAIMCRNQHENLQQSRTSKMIFNVPTLIAYLSSVCELNVGDLIFTGTPEGVGMGRSPQRYSQPGWVLESEIESLGCLRNRFVEA